MSGHLSFVFLKWCVAASVGLCRGTHAVHASTEVTAPLYEAFRERYRNAQHGDPDSVSYAVRLALFTKRHAEIEAHNADASRSWEAGINQFADYTDEEYSRLLNYKRTSDFWSGQAAGSSNQSSFYEQHSQEDVLAEEMDWRPRIPVSNAEHYDQGSCGSCWATAAATVLQMHAEMKGLKAPKLSYEQITSCTDNPSHCGGKGGCKGATSALALKYVVDNVLAPYDLYPNGYQHGGQWKNCNHPNSGTGIRIGSYKRLEENLYDPLHRALAQVGPVVVSIDASGIGNYKSGVFDACSRDAVTNHAVVAVGYGHQESKDYWVLRNSWGSHWGMGGAMHMQRHDPAKTAGDLYCGIDHDAFKGVACDGDKKEVPVCGMCGVLSHGVYPEDVREQELPGFTASQPRGNLRETRRPEMRS